MYAGKAFWINHISIHALREESDIRFCGCAYTNNKISIHALREESDFMIKRLSKK